MDLPKITMTYFSSQFIVEYIKEHPIEWPSRGLADTVRNVRIPFSCIGAFFELLKKKDGLFSQEEYIDYLWDTDRLDIEPYGFDGLVGLEARIKRNFYPSALDSLHAFSILVESGRFARCTLDTLEDVVSKVDLSVTSKEGVCLGIALMAGTSSGKRWAVHKNIYREGWGDWNVIEVPLPMDRPREPGNKCWYNVEDFEVVFKALDHRELPVEEPFDWERMEWIIDSM